jgi:hypothetical protein
MLDPNTGQTPQSDSHRSSQHPINGFQPPHPILEALHFADYYIYHEYIGLMIEIISVLTILWINVR